MPIADSCFSLPKRDLERLWGKLQEHLRTSSHQLGSWFQGQAPGTLQSQTSLEGSSYPKAPEGRVCGLALLCCGAYKISHARLPRLGETGGQLCLHSLTQGRLPWLPLSVYTEVSGMIAVVIELLVLSIVLSRGEMERKQKT